MGDNLIFTFSDDSACAGVNPCFNNAKCVPDDAAYNCTCLPGYEGTKCENGNYYSLYIYVLFCY